MKFYLGPLLLHRLGNILLYVAALFVAIVCKFLEHVVQMQGQEAIIFLVLGSVPIQQGFYF